MVVDHILSQSEVHNNETFSWFIQQRLGTPYCTVKDRQILGGQTKIFFAKFPATDWRTLCKLVLWANQKRLRPERVYNVMGWVNWAWKEGAIPEVDMTLQEVEVERWISEALDVEDDPDWRKALLMAEGDQRPEVIRRWREAHQVQAQKPTRAPKPKKSVAQPQLDFASRTE